MTQNKTKSDDPAAELAAQIQEIRDDISKLSDIVTRLATQKLDETSGIARDTLDDLARRGQEAADQLRSQAKAHMSSVEHTIEDKPFASVLVALAIGFFVGSVMRR